MKKSISVLSSLLFVGLIANAAPLEYKPVADWLKLPPGRTNIGNMHGDVAVSSKGEVYVSVMDPKAAVQVYAPDGKFLRNVPNAPSDFHGFVIRKQEESELLIYPLLVGCYSLR